MQSQVAVHQTGSNAKFPSDLPRFGLVQIGGSALDAQICYRWKKRIILTLASSPGLSVYKPLTDPSDQGWPAAAFPRASRRQRHRHRLLHRCRTLGTMGQDLTDRIRLHSRKACCLPKS